jgi:hypothetical protein
MAGLPKKYAKMGFKKGWREYKKIHGKTRASPSRKRKKSNPKPRGRKTMAKSGIGNLFGSGLGKGLMAGVAVGVIDRVIPINIAGADYIIAGMVMKEPLLQKLGAITLGRSLAGSLTGGLLGNLGGNGNGGGGY